MAAVYGLLLWLLLLIPPSIIVWGLIDANRRPQAAWDAIGQRQWVWLVLQGIGAFVGGVGLLFASFYLIVLRPRLREAMG